MVPKYSYEEMIEQVQGMLSRHSQKWNSDFARYARAIQYNKAVIQELRNGFRKCPQIEIYMNLTEIQNTKANAKFEMRYLGQTIAKIIVSDGECSLSTLNYDEKNTLDFCCTVPPLRDDPWRSANADAFRSFFANRKGPRILHAKNKNNDEHRLESMFLSRFADRKGKPLKFIQPIRPLGHASLRMPMPTPIGASDVNALKYSTRNKGAIDILARVGSGRQNKLCVIELKDKHEDKEPAPIVVRQALAYAVFMRELLRSDCGQEWANLLSLNVSPEKPLTLYAACLMPLSGNADTSFEKQEYSLGKGDKVALHYIFFNEENNAIDIIDTSMKELEIPGIVSPKPVDTIPIDFA